MCFRPSRTSHCLLTAGLLFAALPAEAALITFTDRSAFESATTGLTDVNFDGIVPEDSFMDFPNPAGLTTGGITIRTSGTGSSFVSVYGGDLAAQSPVLGTGTGAILVWAPPDQSGTAFLDVLLPVGKKAFAADVWAQQPFETSVRAVVNSGEATENFDFSTVNRPAPAFFGVISDGNVILLVRFGIPAGQLGLILDSVSVGTANPGGNSVPEPGTMVLAGAGLIAAGLVRYGRAKGENAAPGQSGRLELRITARRRRSP